MKFIFIPIILIHGLIHLLGFAKALGVNIPQLTKDISKSAGMVWLAAAVLFIVIGISFLLRKDSWPLLAIVAVVISQVLIISVWQDAKYGTIANGVILIVSILGLAGQNFESQYGKDVISNLNNSKTTTPELLTESDLQHLPLPVQKYLRYTGVLDKPKVKNVRIVFDGEMRSKGGDWFPFTSVQYNFFEEPARLFFMKAKMFGMPVLGYHRYQSANAAMDIRLSGLIPVVQESGSEMNKAETVTFFNDMCMFIPAALVDNRIEWEPIDELSAKATFTYGGNSISAVLYFNEKGQLINFISDDRYDVNSQQQYRFSTPLKDYKLINDRNLTGFGEGTWHYPDGEFVYGKFYVKDVEYNVRDFN